MMGVCVCARPYGAWARAPRGKIVGIASALVISL